MKYRPGASNPADPLSRLHGTIACAMLAVTVSELNYDLLARIKSESLLDPHFQDEKNTRKYENTVGYFTYLSRIVVPASMQTFRSSLSFECAGFPMANGDHGFHYGSTQICLWS